VVQSEAETSLKPVVAGTFQAENSKEGVAMPGVLASFDMELVTLAGGLMKNCSLSWNAGRIANPGHTN
jgi:hypothetical protein